MILYVKPPKVSIRKLLDLIYDFNNVCYKISIQKPIAFLLHTVAIRKKFKIPFTTASRNINSWG